VRPDADHLDPTVEAEFLGSLTICEDGELRPSVNTFGAVVDKFGVYRMPEDPPEPLDRRPRE
jgi:hypothetical protein